MGVCGYIEELNKKIVSKRIMSAKERKEWLSDLIVNEDKIIKINDKLKAIDILNKMEGEYIEKVELKGNINTNPFSDLTSDELKELIKNDK